MDFSFSEDQTMLRDLAREILEKEVIAEQLKEIEQPSELASLTPHPHHTQYTRSCASQDATMCEDCVSW